VNLIIDAEAVKELIQDDCTPESISEELNNILTNKTDYSTLVEKLGAKVASEETAKLIIEELS